MFTHLLFDLDNTLYPESSSMNEKTTHRTIVQVAAHLGVSHTEAYDIRAKNVGRFGTTLEWLRTEHGFSDEATEKYFSDVHPDDEINEIDPDPNLRPFLQSLNMPMAVLTNSAMSHAERVLKYLGIADLFVHVFDIRAAGLIGKPHRKAYLAAFEKNGFPLKETLFFDDYPRYAQGFVDLGGTAVLIDQKNQYPESHLPRIKSIYEIPALLKRLEETTN